MSEQEKQKENKKEWYHSCWGIAFIILFLLPFAIWWIWAKSGWTKQTKWIVTGIIAVFLIIGMATSGSSTPSTTKTSKGTPTPAITTSASVSPATPTSTPTPTPTLKTISLGDEVILNFNDDKTKCDEQKMVLGYEKKDAEQVTKSSVAKDTEGLVELILQGRGFAVKNCTKAKLIESGFGYRKVRILDGDTAGQAGWLPTEWVRSQ